MATLQELTISFMKRNASMRGPTSSNAWNDTMDELVTDLASISSGWNSCLVPMTSTLPDGTNDLDAFTDGLSGKTIYLDPDATSSVDSTYFNSTESRPNSIKEQIDALYTYVAGINTTLSSEIVALNPVASNISISDVGGFFTSTNVEDALQEINTTVGNLNNNIVLVDGSRSMTSTLTIQPTSNVSRGLYIPATGKHAFAIEAYGGTGGDGSCAYFFTSGSGIALQAYAVDSGGIGAYVSSNQGAYFITSGASANGLTVTGGSGGIAISAQGTDAGTGVLGAGGDSGYGVVAQAATSTPTRSAFRIVPQDTAPAGPNLVGDLYVNSSNSKLYICTVAGTPGTWTVVGTQS